jgi:glycosyltransferase involved in cell wall biosynthesis
MKLLVLAHIPPPVHGQSIMVEALVRGLPSRGIKLEHINLQLSHSTQDIGRWRPGKILAAFGFALRAVFVRFSRGCDTLYYVPAPPAKRGALYRDLIILAICRPFFRRIVFHWHAVGLGVWLRAEATPFERRVSHALLGRADLSIVLAEPLQPDAALLQPKAFAVVPNGIVDPAPNYVPRAARNHPPTVLFLALATRSKGVFAALEGVALAHRRGLGPFRLVVAGPFASEPEQGEFTSRAAALGDAVTITGFVDEARKRTLLASADVFCFPTKFPHEGQPLVLLEALAYNLPAITSRWRAIPSMLPPGPVWLVDPERPEEIADALGQLSTVPVTDERPRQHFLAHFTLERHLDALAAALKTLGP